MLTPDESLPDADRAPAPWSLQGAGWILLLHLRDAVRRDPRHQSQHLQAKPTSGISIVMLVEYANSPVGPYRELLYIPGRFDFGPGRRAWSVTRIYVDSWASVVNGRLNWGIPKDRADFRIEPAGRGQDIEVTIGTRRVAAFSMQARGPDIPAPAGLIPVGLRTLVQDYAGRRFELTLRASGRVGLARVRAMESDAALFPDLAEAKVRLALRVPRFTLTFPVATFASR
jgi:hypothetical protein